MMDHRIDPGDNLLSEEERKKVIQDLIKSFEQPNRETRHRHRRKPITEVIHNGRTTKRA